MKKNFNFTAGSLVARFQAARQLMFIIDCFRPSVKEHQNLRGQRSKKANASALVGKTAVSSKPSKKSR